MGVFGRWVASISGAVLIGAVAFAAPPKTPKATKATKPSKAESPPESLESQLKKLEALGAGSPFEPLPGPLPAIPDAGFLPPNKPFRWDLPKVLEATEVPGTFETNNIPSRFHVVVVGLPFQEAYDHFHRSFVLQGLWVAPPDQQMKLGDGQVALTGFHPNDEVSYTVILQPLSGGRTSAILGEAFWKDRTFMPDQQTFAPVYPGAQHLLTQNLESGRALGYRVKAPVKDVTQFYNDALTQGGFTRQPDGTWARGTELIHVVVTTDKLSGETEVAVVQMGTEDPKAGPYGTKK